jgi:hypothetical protein
MGRTEKIEEQELGKMSNRALTDLIMALLHEVVIRHGRRGGRHHRCTVVAPASPPPSPSAVPHRQVMESPPDQSANRPMVLSDPDAHPRGR